MPTRTFRSLVLLCGVSSAWAAQAEETRPRVVAAWAAGPMEARVAFDRAVDPEVAARVVGESIAFGEGEKPGEVGRVGGDRGALRVAASRLVDEGRTLVLVTDPHPREATYRLALPGLKPPGTPGPGARVELAYDLGGVEVTYVGDQGRSWSGWWPSVDPSATRQALAGSAEHERLWSLTSRPGRISLQTLVSVPKGDVSLELDVSSPFEVLFGTESAKSAPRASGSHRATVKAESTGEPLFLQLGLASGGEGSPRVRVEAGAGALSRSAFVLPWAPPTPSPAPPAEVPAAVLVGGDPARGEVVFHGDQAKCSTCHRVRGKGGVVGPDLSNLAGRDRAWAYRNIVEPSASIHPDYVSYTVSMKDGRVAMGVVRAEGADALKVGDIDAKQTLIPRVEVEEIRPSASSIMPVGLLGAIGEERTRDLLAFLTNASTPTPPK